MTESLDPWLGLVPPDRLDKLYARISDLLDQIDKAEDKPSGEGWREHLAFDSTPRVAFPMAWREVDSIEIDRCASMLSGPLFTSTEYPWPGLSKWRDGRKVPAEGFCEPIFQVDMDLLSQIAGSRLQSGLVQVWMDDKDSIVRFLPSSAVDEGTLSPVPTDVSDFFAHGVPSRRNTYRDWPDEDPVAPWLRRAFRIDHVGEPFHEYPEALEHFLEDLEWNDLDVSDDELDRLDALASDLHRELCEADAVSMHGETLPAPCRPKVCEMTTLFGRFRSAQEGAFDLFGHPAIPLVDLGNCNTSLYWGDGTAQLLTASSEPGAEFRFEWSTS